MSKPNTAFPIPGSAEALTSTSTTDVQTATVPATASFVYATVETTNGRVTTDGTDPTTGTGHILQKDTSPVLLVFGAGSTVKWVSTAAANAVLQLSYYA